MNCETTTKRNSRKKETKLAGSPVKTERKTESGVFLAGDQQQAGSVPTLYVGDAREERS